MQQFREESKHGNGRFLFNSSLFLLFFSFFSSFRLARLDFMWSNQTQAAWVVMTGVKWACSLDPSQPRWEECLELRWRAASTTVNNGCTYVTSLLLFFFFWLVMRRKHTVWAVHTGKCSGYLRRTLILLTLCLLFQLKYFMLYKKHASLVC